VDDTVEALRSKGLQVSGVVCHVGNAEHRSNLIQQTVQVGTQVAMGVTWATSSSSVLAVSVNYCKHSPDTAQLRC